MSTSTAPLRACQECNRKKTKCDMIRPICGLCRRTGNDCLFPLRRKTSALNKTRLNIDPRAIEERMTRLVELLESDPVQKRVLAPSIDTLQSLTRALVTSNHTHENAMNQSALPATSGQTSSFSGARQTNRGGPSTSSRTDETYETPGILTTPEISYSESMFLIKSFFERIQSWLPILHEPRFRKRYAEQLSQKSSCLDDLPVDEKLLLCCIFILGATAAPSGSSSTYPIIDHVKLLSQFSRQIYAEARSMETPTLQYLQGCILLAFTLYTSGLSAHGWILVGVCVRLAYELGLSEIDDPNAPVAGSGDWVELEEMRRAWWLVWELDTFGSCVCRKPFAINRHQFMVKLPISDELWFKEQPCSSSVLLTRPTQSWKSLDNCENQCERAWFLITNHLMATACDYYTRNRGVSVEEKVVLENEINCLRLSLPPNFNIVTGILCSNPTNFAQNNWILGAHLFLTSATYMATAITIEDQDDSSPSLPGSLITESAKTAWDFSVSRIISQWTPEYIDTAHPFLACSFMRLAPAKVHLLGQPNLASSTDDLTTLVLRRFAERWPLASLLIGEFVEMT